MEQITEIKFKGEISTNKDTYKFEAECLKDFEDKAWEVLDSINS